MTDYSTKITLNYPQSHMIFIGWVRYCLGRKTYAVSQCCDWLKANWNTLHSNTQAVILRDIKEEIDRDDRMKEIQQEKIQFGAEPDSVSGLRFWDECDRDEWESVLKVINGLEKPCDRECGFKIGDRIRLLVENKSTGTVYNILPEGIEIVLDVDCSRVVVGDKLIVKI